jgi:hypothetical protein
MAKSNEALRKKIQVDSEVRNRKIVSTRNRYIQFSNGKNEKATASKILQRTRGSRKAIEGKIVE